MRASSTWLCKRRASSGATVAALLTLARKRPHSLVLSSSSMRNVETSQDAVADSAFAWATADRSSSSWPCKNLSSSSLAPELSAALSCRRLHSTSRASASVRITVISRSFAANCACSCTTTLRCSEPWLCKRSVSARLLREISMALACRRSASLVRPSSSTFMMVNSREVAADSILACDTAARSSANWDCRLFTSSRALLEPSATLVCKRWHSAVRPSNSTFNTESSRDAAAASALACAAQRRSSSRVV
mmetsp:Transcript_133182/g.284722  ORF Transcript_133182/g.284722 Transcript_133182/m.284722 type:complete len:249 (+) Transcript_133182:916-1662(+)